MGHFCRMCERVRAYDAFSQAGRTRNLCRECARVPLARRERKDRLSLMWQILLRESVISARYIEMASVWAQESDPAVAALAQAIVEVGRASPRKRKRLSYLRQHHTTLWQLMIAAGLVNDLSYDVSASEPMVMSII